LQRDKKKGILLRTFKIYIERVLFNEERKQMKLNPFNFTPVPPRIHLLKPLTILLLTLFLFLTVFIAKAHEEEEEDSINEATPFIPVALA